MRRLIDESLPPTPSKGEGVWNLLFYSLEFKIKHITRKDLDVAKYDACIAEAVNSRIYAYSWYLDAVADNWDVLVYGDYQAVMPLPWRRKYFIHYIYTPAWIQQLGIFSVEELHQNLIQSFLQTIPFRFLKISLLLNEDNKWCNRFISVRDNYILSLLPDYQALYSSFKKNRKQSLREAQQYNIKIRTGVSGENAIALHRSFIQQRTNLTEMDYQKLTQLFQRLIPNKQIFYYDCFQDNERIGSAVFLNDKQRYYYLMSAVNDKGKQTQAMSVILNQFLKDHSGEDAIFDFEGSMISGIASFFSSFGAEKVRYYHYQKSLLN